MPFGLKLWKKPWEKVMCSFELQEYGAEGSKGWSSITEPTGQPISKEQAREFFKPDKHYRVIARALEGEQAGRFIGIVWQHYEPARGIIKKEREKREKPQPRPKEPEEILDAYVDKVERVLEPIPRIFEVLDRIRGKFVQSEGRAVSEVGGEASYQIPPPEFDGKLPAIMHPYVVHIIAEEVKGVIDYGATRLQQAFGAGGLPAGQPPPKEEEEEFLPSITKFKERKRMLEKVEEEEEVELPELVKEEKEVEEVAAEEAVKEAAVEVPTEPEVVPSLEKEPIKESMQPRRCVNCGRYETEVKLLPNGLCEECAAKLAEEEKLTPEEEADVEESMKEIAEGKAEKFESPEEAISELKEEEPAKKPKRRGRPKK